MDTFLASLGIFAGAALFVGPPVLLIWGLCVILNRPSGVKKEHDFCPYIERDVYGNARIMKATFDANVAEYEAELNPAYGRGNQTPAYQAPAPLAVQTPHLQPQASRQVQEVPIIDKWLAAGNLLQELNAQLPTHQSTALLPSGDVVDGEWVEIIQYDSLFAYRDR